MKKQTKGTLLNDISNYLGLWPFVARTYYLSDRPKGILLALLTATISGVAIFYSKLSLIKIDPLILATSRNLYVAVLFILLFVFSKRFEELRQLKRKDLFYLVLIGIIGGSIPFYLFFTGLQFVNPQTANLIHKSLFIWVSLLAVIFLKERLNLMAMIAFLLVFLGIYYFNRIPFQLGKGETMILTATLLWSGEKVLAKVSSELAGLFRMGLGSIILLITVIMTGNISKLLTINNQQLTIIVTGGTILFFYVHFWFKALKYAPASLVSLVLTFSVVVGSILNGTFAGVKILPKDIYSSLLIFMAAVSILTSQMSFRKIK